MADDVTSRVIAIVQEILRGESGRSDLTVSADDTMETVAEWDSMSFMKVFLSINEAFGIDPDFDEAIHYTSVARLTEFLSNEFA